MDLTLPLIGVLGVVGYNMNSTVNTRNYTKKRSKIPDSELNNSQNVYNSRPFSRIQEAEIAQVQKIRKNNELTTLNEKSDALRIKKKVTFNERNVDDYSPSESITPDNKIFKGPMFSSEKYFIPSSPTSAFEVKEGFSNISELTGKKTDFSHQNMTPFFGGKIKGSINSDTLGRYTGRDLGDSKKELVNEINGPVNNVNGNVLFTDTISQDRFVVPDLRTGMIPFKQERVKPIPGEYNRGSSKTSEELYLKAKTSLEGRMNVGQAIGRRGLQGEGKKVSREQVYEVGKDRQFVTTGVESGKYYEDTDYFKQSKKNLIAEATLNQLGKVAYNYGERTGVTKVVDGINTFVQSDKKGDYVNDWVRSAKVATGLQNFPTMDNIRLRIQERATTSKEYIGNAVRRVKAETHRQVDNLKTTNKELSLYSYKGIAEGPVKKAHEREAWYNNETRTKASGAYTPGGSKQGAPGVGAGDFYYETKESVFPKDSLMPASTNIKKYQELGNVTKNPVDNRNVSRSDRNIYIQKTTYDRPMSKLA